ncbi:GntR family transcriptional regulator [Nonomuraea sp. NPDC050404]|uniref:GntR family transcriptional regulator n=1 Tax=Nonomuraea sp. NPDC050404 TaxID=3155783 RepID=UPI0033DA72A6
MSEHASETPLYLSIANDVRNKIDSGALMPNAQLPSERDLCAQWNCSLRTVRHALIDLRNEGLIYTPKGAVNLVAAQHPLIRIAPDRWRRRPDYRPTYQTEAARSHVEVQVSHETEHVEAPAEVAQRLGIDEGNPVTETAYEIRMEGELVSVSVTWEPLDITGGTEIEFPHQGPYASRGIVPRFDAIGLHVGLEEEAIWVRMPERHETVQLHMPANVPVVEIWQTFWAADVAVEVAKIIFRADRYKFHFRSVIT